MSAGEHVVMSAGHVKVRRVGLMLRVVIEGVDGERITVEIGKGDLTLLDDNTATVDTWIYQGDEANPSLGCPMSASAIAEAAEDGRRRGDWDAMVASRAGASTAPLPPADEALVADVASRLAPGFEPVEGAEPVLRVPRSIDVAALADARVVDGGQS